MRFGCFSPIERLGDLVRAGFREAELDICEVMALSEVEYRSFIKAAWATGLEFHAFSGLIPLSERFHFPAFDRKKWLTHAEAAAERTSRLGCTIWPFGAGKCRSIPFGADRTEGEKRVREFVFDVCRTVSKYGITLLIEPLGPANSNYLQTIGEAAAFAESVGLDNCRSMCDLRHMVKIGEPMADIATYSGWIGHAHIDYPGGTERRFPREGDGYDYRPYLRALSESGYDGILSVEATVSSDFGGDARQSALYLEQLLLEVATQKNLLRENAQ